MKKATLKKALAIVLCLITSLSALTMFASADTATPTFAKTVYMSNSGADTNDGLTELTPVATLEKATEIVGADGGEIIILNDITQDISEYDGSVKYVYLKSSNKTIYVHGKKKLDNSYPKLIFDAKGNSATVLELSGPLAIYDLTIGACQKSSTGTSMWISANGYPLTMGNNVTAYDHEGSVPNITGGRFNKTSSLSMRDATEASVVNIYSGNWGQIYGGSYDQKTVQTGGATVNMMGGSAACIHAARTGSEVTGTCTINLYDGTISSVLNRNDSTQSVNKDPYKGIGSFAADGRTNVLNVYADSVPQNITDNLVGVFYGEGAITPTLKTGDAPDFWELSAYSFTEAAPPQFEEDPDLGNANTGNTDNNKNDDAGKNNETKADDTTEASEAEVEEDGGCGSAIGGMGIALVVAALGTSVVVGKKKKQ